MTEVLAEAITEVLAEAITQGSFRDFALREELQRALTQMQFAHPTEIQQQAIPLALKGEDFIGQAKTGTGKTAAFGLPMLQTLASGQQGLILVPTRELALQVTAELRKFSKFWQMRIVSLYGGQSINVQFDELTNGVDIIVATPGRLLDHLERRTVSLQNVKIVVLDEADRMLDMGFRPDIVRILDQIPRQRQTMLFSATMQDEVVALAQNYMRSTQRIGKSDEIVVSQINQEFYLIERNRKISLLVDVLRREGVGRTIIFCSTRRQVDFLTEKLMGNGFRCMAIHAGLRQTRRDKVMAAFRAGQVQMLIATDVAARGIDVQNISHVVNYDLPQSAEDYVHRIGRTARAGKSGKAITLVSPNDAPIIIDIQHALGITIPQGYVERFPRVPLQTLDIESIRQQEWMRQSRFGNCRGPATPARGAFRKHQDESFGSGAVPYNIMD